MKIILIFSDESLDVTADSVIDWLRHYKASFLRIKNLHDKFRFKISFNTENKLELTLTSQYHKKELSVASAWFRRWGNTFDFDNIDSYTSVLIEDEKKVSFSYFCLSIDKGKWVNHPEDCDNKLQQLYFARSVGLKTPDTIIANNDQDLKNFSSQYDNFIVTKTYHQISYQFDNLNYSNFTTELGSIDIPAQFTPGIFQEGIKKQFDLRIFYLKGKFFVSAIMPLSVNYNLDVRENPKDEFSQRIVPYELPLEIEDKIKLFMEKMDINSGSIDMLVTDNFDYIFLELNPIGQNKYYSDKCNYYIEEAIARTLINISNEE